MRAAAEAALRAPPDGYTLLQVTSRLRQYLQRVGYLMLSGNRHWLEYDSVALVVLFVGIGFVALIVLGI